MNALRSNSSVRQTALQLLQQSQLQGAQFPPRQASTRQLSLDGSDVYTAAGVGAPGSSTQTDLLYAHTGSSSSLPQLVQHQGQHSSPQRSPQQLQAGAGGLFGLRAEARMPPQQAARRCQDNGEGVGDWAHELEGELLGCLQDDAHLAAAGACINMQQQQRSSACLAGLAMQQQQRRAHRHFHAPSAPQLQYQPCYPQQQQQQQQGWPTAPLPAPCVGIMPAAPAASSRFQADALMSLQSLLAVDGDCSPVMDPVGSASSSSNNSFGLARSGYSSQTRANAGHGFHSQPLPALLEQEGQGWGGIKRRNSIDPDQVRTPVYPAVACTCCC